MTKALALASSFLLASTLAGCAPEEPADGGAPSTRQALSSWSNCAEASYLCMVAGVHHATCDHLDNMCAMSMTSNGGQPRYGSPAGRTACQISCLDVRRGCFDEGYDGTTCSEWYGWCMGGC